MYHTSMGGDQYNHPSIDISTPYRPINHCSNRQFSNHRCHQWSCDLARMIHHHLVGINLFLSSSSEHGAANQQAFRIESTVSTQQAAEHYLSSNSSFLGPGSAINRPFSISQTICRPFIVILTSERSAGWLLTICSAEASLCPISFTVRIGIRLRSDTIPPGSGRQEEETPSLFFNLLSSTPHKGEVIKQRRKNRMAPRRLI